MYRLGNHPEFFIMTTAVTAPPAQESSADSASYVFWGMLALVVAMLIQAPASLLKKALPVGMPVAVTAWGGSVWHGQMAWQENDQQGQLAWDIRPWRLLTGKLGVDFALTGDVQLAGQAGLGLGGSWQVSGVSGTVPANALRPFMPAGFNLPGSVRLSGVGLGRAGLAKGAWRSAEGTLHWQGGTLTFDLNGQQTTATTPPLFLQLQIEGDALAASLMQESDRAALASVKLHSNSIMETSVLQRLLAYSPGYHGNGGPDQVVLTASQPF